MKCYDCGKTIKVAIRAHREPKDHRYKSQFRDICEDCYVKDMTTQGYQLIGRCWQKAEINEMTSANPARS